jgi:hypothetical protein
MKNETYLGDGLYASFDGFMFWLRAPREDRDHLVALEPEVLIAFNNYVMSVHQAQGIIKADTAPIE